MGSFSFLVCHEKKLYVEAFKNEGYSTPASITVDSQLLVGFMEYCMKNRLQVEIVPDSWFDSQEIRNEDDFYEEFKL